MMSVRVRDLHFDYAERETLAGVSFEVAAGEGVALLGPNGAGKTTLLRLLMAFQQPRAGTVEIGGRSTRGLHPEDLTGTVGFLFQRPEDQLFRRTVRDDVRFGPETLRWDAARIDAAVERSLEELDLQDVAALHPYDLPASAGGAGGSARAGAGAPASRRADRDPRSIGAGSRRHGALCAQVARDRHHRRDPRSRFRGRAL